MDVGKWNSPFPVFQVSRVHCPSQDRALLPFAVVRKNKAIKDQLKWLLEVIDTKILSA